MNDQPAGDALIRVKAGFPWARAGWIVTFIWAAALGWHLWLNHPGGLIEAPGPLPAALNELGDFLAGAFAPLAFLWLFIAVMVQAQELSLQRRELKLTRKEFELNRRVAEETRLEIAQQAAAAKENAVFVGKQTDILTLQLKREQTRDADEEFSDLLDRIGSLIRNRIAGKVAMKGAEGRKFWLIHIGPANVPESRDDALYVCTDLLLSALARLKERILRGEMTFSKEDEYQVSDLAELIAHAVALEPRVSDPNKVMIRALHLDPIVTDLTDIVVTFTP